MGQLQVKAEGVAMSTPEVVWGLISDANSYQRWGPWEDGGYRPSGEGPSRIGSIQWFRYGRRTISVEEILAVEAPRRLTYKVIHGLPVKNYQAEVTLTSTTSNGTSICWAAAWDDTFMGRIVHRKLRHLYPEIVQALISASNGE